MAKPELGASLLLRAPSRAGEEEWEGSVGIQGRGTHVMLGIAVGCRWNCATSSPYLVFGLAWRAGAGLEKGCVALG